MINGARVATEWEDPKYVVKPAHVQTAWLHWPGIVDRGRMYIIPNEWNFMLHFRNMSMVDYFSTLVPRAQRVRNTSSHFSSKTLNFFSMFALFNYQIGDVINPSRSARLR